MKDDTFLTTFQVAHIFGISSQNLCNRVSRGKFPKPDSQGGGGLGGKCNRWRKSTIIDMLYKDILATKAKIAQVKKA